MMVIAAAILLVGFGIEKAIRQTHNPKREPTTQDKIWVFIFSWIVLLDILAHFVTWGIHLVYNG